MRNFKATLFIGKVEIDYIIFESKDLRTAGLYVDLRFDKAYPQFANHKDAQIVIEEV